MAMVSTMTTVVFGYGYSLNSLSLWIRLWFELGPWYQGVVALESSIFFQNTLKNCSNTLFCFYINNEGLIKKYK